MLNPEDIIKLRKQHDVIYNTRINNTNFVWRLLAPIEYDRIIKIAKDQFQIDDLVCQDCVIDPVINWLTESVPAGWASTLAPLILDESGIISPAVNEELYIGYKALLETDLVQQAQIVINTAFPEYTLEKIETWNVARLWKMATKAMWKLKLLNRIHNEAKLENGYIIPDLSLDLVFGGNKQKESKQQEAQRLRLDGIDPMEALVPLPRFDRNFIQFPYIYGWEDFIYGPEWENPSVNEEMLDAARILERSSLR